MPTWSDILQELLSRTPPNSTPPYDEIRRKYLFNYSELVGRDVIVYASGWTHNQSGSNYSIVDQDVHAFMEVTHGLKGEKLDLFLHSPGGSIDAADALVSYLRQKFKHIRAVIPQVALSAATMIACACDELILAKHTSMGPIDPQLIIPSANGPKMAAAHAILKQFDRCVANLREKPEDSNAYYPIILQYGPDLLEFCHTAIERAEELVESYLEKWMFEGEKDAKKTAKRIAKALGDYSDHKSHGRHLNRAEITSVGLRVLNLEDDQDLQDAALSVHHATMLSFMSGPTKIVENQLGRCYILHS